ncbi:MAG: GreA/GreB family elongation factor [Candidatus Nanopelagicales bacterium]
MAGDLNKLVLTKDGKAELQVRIDHLRNEVLPGFKPLIGETDRDEGIVQEFTRLTEEADELDSLIAMAGEIDVEAFDGTVSLGCTVSVHTESDKFKVKIVHPVEAHLDDERIASDSPLGKALLGAKKGDVVEVMAPSGNWNATIKSVKLVD